MGGGKLLYPHQIINNSSSPSNYWWSEGANDAEMRVEVVQY